MSIYEASIINHKKQLEFYKDLSEQLQQENQKLMKALKEKEKWLSICILNLMEEYKTDTIWITSQQMETNKNKNICYEVYKSNDVKFYQNKK